MSRALFIRISKFALYSLTGMNIYTMAASTKLSDYGLSDKMGFMPSTQPSKRLPGKAPVIHMLRNYDHVISHSHHIMAT